MDKRQKENFVIAYNSAKNLHRNLVGMFSLFSACTVPDVFVSEWAQRNIDAIASTLGELERILPAIAEQSIISSHINDIAVEAFHDNLSNDVKRQLQERLLEEVGTNARSLYRSLDNISSGNVQHGFDIFIDDWVMHKVKNVAEPILREYERIRANINLQLSS